MTDTPQAACPNGDSEVAAAAALTSLMAGASSQSDSESHGEEIKIPRRLNKNGKLRAIPFPFKLMRVLIKKEYQNIITWTKDGKAFKIVDPEAFVSKVLPLHFKSAQFASFTRKLHRWGFKRIEDDEEFFHENFQRGRVDLAEKMTCYTGIPKSGQASARATPPKANAGAAVGSPTRRIPRAVSPTTPTSSFVPLTKPALMNGPLVPDPVAPCSDSQRAVGIEALRLKKCIEAASATRRMLAMMHQEQRSKAMMNLQDPRFLPLGYAANPSAPMMGIRRRPVGTMAFFGALAGRPQSNQQASFWTHPGPPGCMNMQGAKTA